MNKQAKVKLLNKLNEMPQHEWHKKELIMAEMLTIIAEEICDS